MSESDLVRSKLLDSDSVRNYMEEIDRKVNGIVIDNILHYGNLKESLKVPRRGWLLKGIHPDLAETSLEHSVKLRDAAQAYAGNPGSDITMGVLGPMLDVHDHIDAIFFDITPHDDISPEEKKVMEEYGMRRLYVSLRNGYGNEMLGHYGSFDHGRKRERAIANFLDKQDAAVQARDIRNNGDKLRETIEGNRDYMEFLFRARNLGNDLERSLDHLFLSLGEFYTRNMELNDVFIDPFMRTIASQVEQYEGRDTYRYYYNLLSTINLRR